MRDAVFGNAKKDIVGKVETYPLDGVDQQFEPELGFETNWVQDQRNHRSLLDCFWNHVRIEGSLVFFYAKQVPLVEDTGRRVLIGVGRVKHIGNLTEYKYDGTPSDKLRSMLWECMITHSIRPEFEDGFLLPYHEALDKSDEGRAFDPAEAVTFAPDDRFNEFSYATEHVGNDAAISALLSIRDALDRRSELFGYSSDTFEQWIDNELGRLWKKRGPSIACKSIRPRRSRRRPLTELPRSVNLLLLVLSDGRAGFGSSVLGSPSIAVDRQVFHAGRRGQTDTSAT